MNRERITGFLLMLSGIVFTVLASRIEMSHASGEAGPRLFPYMASILLIVFGAIIFIRNADSSQKPFFTTTGWKKVGAMSGLLILYPLELVYFGFIPSGLITTFGLTRVFAAKKEIPLKNQIVFTVISTLVVFYLFRHVLHIVLPEGLLIDLLKG